MKFIIDREKYIDSGLVNEQFHPEFPLVIYNYSQKCQFSKAWDEVTMMCRGLIVNKDTYEIVARPFTKFFNYEEHLALGLPVPSEEPIAIRKLDGSLGILYWWNDLPFIATRGSFTSNQAIWATEWVRKNLDYSQFDVNYTYLFEIIYPENKIVVSYDFSGLVMIGAMSIENQPIGERGVRVPPNIQLATRVPYTGYHALKEMNTPNEEGFVLFFPRSNVRMKIKFDDYIRLHKIVTGLSEIGIWEMLREGKNPITPEIPDEMFKWINGVVLKLKSDFFCIEEESGLAHLMCKNKENRKEQAEFINKTRYPSVVFSMLDGKDYKSIIWKMLRPKGQKTFRKDLDL